MDAAENEFVAVAIYNNIQGKDKIWLDKFSEPSWNNPIVRFLNTEEEDLIPRKKGVYSTAKLLQRMILALEKSGKKIPLYLQLANQELNPVKKSTATFAMYCYWVGEKKLGSLEGVLASRIGMLKGYEVVELDFDPTKISYQNLVEKAEKFKCTQRVFARNKEQSKIASNLLNKTLVELTSSKVDTSTQQQYHLSKHPDYYYLPLTPLQATRLNFAIASGKKPEKYLSPNQIELLERIRKKWNRKKVPSLKPDRSFKGIAAYAKKLQILLAK